MAAKQRNNRNIPNANNGKMMKGLRAYASHHGIPQTSCLIPGMKQSSPKNPYQMAAHPHRSLRISLVAVFVTASINGIRLESLDASEPGDLIALEGRHELLAIVERNLAIVRLHAIRRELNERAVLLREKDFVEWHGGSMRRRERPSQAMARAVSFVFILR